VVYASLGAEVTLQRDDKPKLLNRLKRVEGQVRGVARMVADDRYCIDIMTQLSAVRAALTRVESELLKGHLDHCIESAIVSGNQAEQRLKASELIELLERSAR
jgi:DNA-binding FrmR family transcriptional regulator